mgnify:CR=1 FL=1
MKRLNLVLLLCLFTSLVWAKDLTPKFGFQAKGGVTDLVVNNNKLYVATKASSVDVFNISTTLKESSITLPQIEDFMGDIIDSKIYSIDVLENRVLIVSQGVKGGRNIDIYENGKLTNIISDKKRYFIAKAKFVTPTKILFSLLSNQLYFFDIKTNKSIYVKQVSQSKFSDFVLNEKKDMVIVTDESGDLQLINVKDGHMQTTLSGQNLDNVFQLDWKNNTILTAGQDRRAVVYTTMNSKPYYKKSTFLIYSCALSPKGEVGAYSSDEENNVTVFNTRTNSDLYKLTQNKMTLTKMVFLNEKEILVASDDNVVNFYKLQ